MSCLMCDGTGFTSKMLPCPKCSGNAVKIMSINPWVPMQYQGVRYSVSALPLHMTNWGVEMTQIRDDIVARTDTKNYLICSPYRTGKTIWAYDLLDQLASRGYQVQPIVDIMDLRRMMMSYKEEDVVQMSKYISIPVLVIRIPPMVNSSVVHTIQTIMYRRVASNGQTIFLFPGDYYTLMDECGNKDLMSSILGDGSLSSIKLKNYRRKSNDAQLQD